MKIDGYEVTFIKRWVPKEEAALERAYLVCSSEDEWALTEPNEYWTFGWKVTIGKQQYGDFVRLQEPVFDLVEPTLIEQAREVIKAMKQYPPKPQSLRYRKFKAIE